MNVPTLAEKEGMRRAAELFKVLGHPRRIEILLGLQDGPLRMKEISERLHIPFKDVSNDVVVLRSAVAIRRTVEDRWSPWEITPFGRALLQTYILLSHLIRPETPPET